MHVGHSVSTEYTLQEKDHTFKLAEVEEGCLEFTLRMT